MKAQFKYSFLAGLYVRGPVFAVVFIMNTVFITLGSLGLLPFAAHVTAVALAGTAIALIMAVNIIGDIAICRQMFSSPRAYLFALTPVPRWKTLLAGIITMAVLDIITMTISIVSVVWLSLNMTGLHSMWSLIALGLGETSIFNLVWGTLLILGFYFHVLVIILFSVSVKKSVLFNVPASGFLAVLLAHACFYLTSLLQIVLAPLGVVERYGLFILINIGFEAAPLLFLLIMLVTSGLFIVTSKLMEKWINLA